MSARTRTTRAALTDRGRALLAAGLTLSASGPFLGFVDLTRLGVFITFLPAVAFALSRYSPPRLDVHRSSTVDQPMVGRPLPVRVQVRNVGGATLPRTVMVEEYPRPLTAPRATLDGATPPLGTGHAASGPRPRRMWSLLHRATPGRAPVASFDTPSITPGDCLHLNYTVTPTQRGRLVLGPWRVRVDDPLGLVRRHHVVAESATWIVLPRTHPLGPQPDTTGVHVHGGVPTPTGSSSGADFTIRPYRYGDDLRRVHWAATAHRGELQVRHEVAEAAERATLLIDPGTFTDGMRGHGLDLGVEILASVASHLAHSGVEVTLEPPAHESSSAGIDAHDILERLALLDPPSTPTNGVGVPHPPTYTRTVLPPHPGTVVAVVGANEHAAARFFSAHPASAAALAVVVPTGSSTSATAVVDAGCAAGWRTIVLGADGIAPTWARLVAQDAPR